LFIIKKLFPLYDSFRTHFVVNDVGNNKVSNFFRFICNDHQRFLFQNEKLYIFLLLHLMCPISMLLNYDTMKNHFILILYLKRYIEKERYRDIIIRTSVIEKKIAKKREWPPLALIHSVTADKFYKDLEQFCSRAISYINFAKF
ncbi:hypothetical protein BpHYR1_044181, partial [Brachionus plicatilis]